jgi:hypothetical protein
LVDVPELGNLGRADEREVHRPEEEDAPLAGVRRVGDLLELLAVLGAHDGLELELGQLVSDGQHGFSFDGETIRRRADWSKTLFRSRW